MTVIRDTSVVPPNGWPYTVQSTGTKIVSHNYAMLYPKIRQHCLANNVQPPSEQEVIDTLCRTLSIPCYESESRTPLINNFSLGVPNAPRLGTCCS